MLTKEQVDKLVELGGYARYYTLEDNPKHDDLHDIYFSPESLGVKFYDCEGQEVDRYSTRSYYAEFEGRRYSKCSNSEWAFNSLKFNPEFVIYADGRVFANNFGGDLYPEFKDKLISILERVIDS